MSQDKQLQKILIVAVLTSLLVGWVAGVLGGTYSKSYIIPWFEKNFLGKAVTEVGPSPVGEKVLQAAQEESATIGAVKKVSPAVVSIVISKDLNKIYNLTGPDVFPFPDFFEFGFPFEFGFNAPEGPKTPDGNSQKQTVGGGTGFIISEDGLVLTNKHVVADAEAEYTVITNDDKKYDAKILATDPFLDMAVLKIEVLGLPTVELGDSAKLELGQTVIAIGYSLGEYRNTVTKGVISGMGRRVVAGDRRGGSEVIEEAIQTDAAINPGNSGGPLINLAGQVIGINTAMNLEGQLIGFAIPINAVKKSVESVKREGKIIRPWLGVRYVIINEEIAKENNLEVKYGALIVRGQRATELAIVPGSPADKAGLVENDIILEINGQKIDEDYLLAREIAKYKPGDEITLKILHKGEEKILKAQLAEFKE